MKSRFQTTIWILDTNLLFKCQTSLVFRWLLYVDNCICRINKVLYQCAERHESNSGKLITLIPDFYWSCFRPQYLKSRCFYTDFKCFYDKMAAICPDFKCCGFRISDSIQNSDHLKTNLFLTIQKQDMSIYQIPTVSKSI